MRDACIPMIQALWANFSTTPGSPLDALCVLHRDGLRIVSSNGKVFSVSLPCIMGRLWPLPVGLAMERALFSPNEGAFRRGIPFLDCS